MNTLITLNWNTTDLLIGMLESAYMLSSQTFKTIIIDNGSTIEEYSKLQRYLENKQNTYKERTTNVDFINNIFEYNNKDSSITLKRLEKNTGFAAGNNHALSILKECDLVFFINSDIVIEEQNWDCKFSSLFKSLNAGVLGCAYHALRWSSNGHFQIQNLTETPVLSESVQGAFFSIPFNLLQEVRKKDNCWFDENFKFAHYEETDLQFRIMNMGYKCFWIPCKHTHLHFQSSTKKNGYHLSDEIKNLDDFKKNSEKNRQLLISKHQDFFKGKL